MNTQYYLVAALFTLSAAGSCFAEELISADEILAGLTNVPKTVRIAPETRPAAVHPDKYLCRQTHGPAASNPTQLYPQNLPSLDLAVAFEFGKAKLSDVGKRQLDQLAVALKHPSLAGQPLALAGHTDAVGSQKVNDRLSCERALAVRHYLQRQHGVDASHLVPLGFGSQLLKNPADPTDGLNRRVELRRLPAKS